MHLLTNDTWRYELCRQIDLACTKFDFNLHAFVFMSNHVHLLVYPNQKLPNIGQFLASLKQPFSKYVKQMLVDNNSPLLEKLTVKERPGKYCFRFWQEGGGYDRNLYESTAVEASITYIHMNPVKKDLCLKTTDWKWSSARFYELGEIDKDLPTITSLPFELFD